MKLTKTEYFQLIDKTQSDLRSLIEAKNTDYTGGEDIDDPFANFRQSEDLGVDPLVGLFIRMGDKFQRIKAFARTGKLAVPGEGVEDAIKDIMGYSLIALGLLSERNPGGTVTQPQPEAVEETPDSEDGYDYLKPDDVIQEGDEWTDCFRNGKWWPCDDFVGETFNESYLWGGEAGSQTCPEGTRVRRKVIG